MAEVAAPGSADGGAHKLHPESDYAAEQFDDDDGEYDEEFDDDGEYYDDDEEEDDEEEEEPLLKYQRMTASVATTLQQVCACNSRQPALRFKKN